jgi:polyhydroxybutyrate depolymerase
VTETKCVAPIPVLVVHRTHDETMKIAGGRDAAERWAKIDGCAEQKPIANGCLAWTGCAGGAVTFCEDVHFDPQWPRSWNHTMREPYQDLAWRWFQQMR